MEIISIFAILCLIVFLGFFAEIIFKKFNIPDIIILIGVGILIRSVFKLVNPENFSKGGVEIFTTFALIFILFQGSLNIEFKVLFKSLPKTFKLTILNFILTVLIVALISFFLKYTILEAILIGVILGGTSSAVVIPLVNNVDLREKYSSVLTLESALSDVLCIIGTVTILEIIKTGEILPSVIFRSVLSSFSLAIVVGLLVGLVWVLFLSKYESLSKSYMLTIALVVGLYAFVESSYVSASGAIAALSFGLFLGNSRSFLNFKNRKKKLNGERNSNVVLNFAAKNFYAEISFFVKTFFFVYLGILIDFSNPIIFLYGGFLTIAMFLIRPFAVKVAFSGDNLEQKERTFLEILIPKGLAAAVLSGVVVNSGVLSNGEGIFVNMILSVVLLSILLTSILVFLSEKELFKSFLPFLNSVKK